MLIDALSLDSGISLEESIVIVGAGAAGITIACEFEKIGLNAILIESGLSFLGIGVPDDIVTWGSLLNLGRQNLEAWWLIIYPGMAIFITITIYNMIAEASRDALDPRLKS